MVRFFLLFNILLLFTVANGQTHSADSIVDVAVGWRDRGNSYLAVKELDDLLAADRTNERALYELAYTHLINKNYILAMISAKRASDLNGSYRTDARLVLSQCYIARGELRRAMRMLKTLPGDDSRVAYNKAVVCYRNQKLDDAEVFAQQAITVDKSFVEAHLLLSYVMIDKGERMKAMLPLYYFLLLNNDNEDAVDAVKQLNALWTAGSARLIGRQKKTESRGFYFKADAFIENVARDEIAQAANNGEKIARLVRETKQLFGYLKDKSEDNFDFYQIAYSDFFIQLFDQGYSEPFVNYACYEIYKVDVIDWIAGNGEQFNRFRIWMEAR